uniref:Double PHD fingers 1 n=1 Tax=Canis lupus familiaris TaxID=9615 RepID=A0A8P0TW09_CANLF
MATELQRRDSNPPGAATAPYWRPACGRTGSPARGHRAGDSPGTGQAGRWDREGLGMREGEVSVRRAQARVGRPCGPLQGISKSHGFGVFVLGEDFYREAIEHCRSYNARLCAERSLRLPFLDSQTGVAQNNCYIWMEKTHRGPGLAPGQIYTYPARCWRKKRRLNILEDPRLRPCEYKIDCEAPLKKEGGLPEGPVLEALLCAETGEKKIELKEEETIMDCQKQQLLEFPHDLEVEDLEDDIPRRKNRAKGKAYGIGGLRKRQDTASLEDRDKPYVCDSESF